MRILGIDPGTSIMGYGLIIKKGKDPDLITMGFIELRKIENHYDRLQHIFNRVIQIIDAYKPDEVALEAPFYGKNVQSMLKLGRAQGVAMAAALSRSLPIIEYAPRKIKQAITGHGNASKMQVAKILQQILKIDELPDNLDTTDGLAAAVCHCYNFGISSEKNGYKSWKDFINKNPGRVSG
jgi:crossover junction endodeoxyribonuclease RuvC